MTNDQQIQSVLETEFTFRVVDPSEGQVNKTDWNNVAGVIHAILAFAVVLVFRVQDGGEEVLLGLGTTVPIPVPDPDNPGGDMVVAWSTAKLFWSEGQHRIFARFVLDGKNYDTPHRTFSISMPLVKPVISNPKSKQVVHTRSVPVSGRIPENSTFTGVTVKVFLDQGEQPIGEDTPSTRSWGTSVNLAPGAHSIVAQSIKGMSITGRTEPVLFYVAPPALINVAVDITDDNWVIFSGGGHEGATVRLNVVSGPGGVAPPDVHVQNGKWETTAKHWPFGSYQMQAFQLIADSAGGWIESLPSEFVVDLG